MAGFNFSGFGNLGTTDINPDGGFQKDPNKLECKPENGRDGMYEFFGRFLPNPYDSTKSMISKSVVRIKNPAVNGESVTFDCPKSVFKPSFFHTVDKVLKQYEDKPGFTEVVKSIRKNFNRWYSITSLMYVSQDACHPENVNKIKVFQYGMAIKNKIDDAQKGTPSTPPCRPFDLLAGKDFHYIATVKSKSLGFADYTNCNFMEKPSPFKYFMDGSYYEVSAQELDAMTKGQKTLLVKLYEEQCPDMTRYEYAEPTQDQLMKAAGYIRIIFAQYPTLLQEIINSTDDKAFVDMIMAAGGIMQPQQPQFGQQPMYGQQPVYGQPMYGQQPVYGQPMPNMQPQAFGTGTITGQAPQQPVQEQVFVGQKPVQEPFIQAPSVNTFAQQPAQQASQPQFQQAPVPSEGGFIPQPQQPAEAQAPQQEEIRTFGGGSANFQEAMNNLQSM